MKLIEQWRQGILADQRKLQTMRVIATIESSCNLACEHCYWAHDIPRLSEQNWDEQSHFLKKINAPVFFAGRILNDRGATFLRRIITDQSMNYLGIVDNGTTILKYPEFFGHYGSIDISIDGWKEQHDRQRNRAGLFDEAWETVMKLKEYGLNPVISAAISPLTMQGWEKFENLLIENDVPMSSSPVVDHRETVLRGTATFQSMQALREAFQILLEGMPKIINMYSLDYVSVIKDMLAEFEWTTDNDDGDCLTATIPTGTILVYRPTSLSRIGELSLQWDGLFHIPSTYGVEGVRDDVDESFFRHVHSLNQQELAVWSEITPLVERRK